MSDATAPARAAEAEQGARERRWLTPGVRGIGAASLLADLGHEIPTSLLPSLLTSTLGAPAAALGAIEGAADGLAGAARLGGGALADDPHRRRKVAVGGYTATAILSSLIGAASAVWQVAILRAGAWTARGLRVPARNALLADIAPAHAYGRAYGFERAMDNSARSPGRCSASSSSPPSASARRSCCRSSRACSPPPRSSTPPATPPASARASTSRSACGYGTVLRGPLGRLMAGVGIFELANLAATLLILRATELLQPDHGNDRAAQLALALYTAYNLAATLASVPAGHAGDRHGPAPVLTAGAASFAAAYLILALTGPNLALLAPGFLLAGIGIGAETAQHAAVAALAPQQLRGSAFGLLAGLQSLGNLAASTIAGVLWTAVSPTAAFLCAAALMTLALPALATTAGRGTAPHARHL